MNTVCGGRSSSPVISFKSTSDWYFCAASHDFATDVTVPVRSQEVNFGRQPFENMAQKLVGAAVPQG